MNLILAFVFYFITKKHPESKSNKYIFLIFAEMIIFFLSTECGVIMFISYVLIPLCSCIFFDEKLTFRILILCFLCMIPSFIIRSFTIPDVYIWYSRPTWLLKFGFGSFIEYTVYGVFCYILAKETRIALTSIYEHKQSIKVIQDQLIFGFANIVEAKDINTGHHVKRTSEYVKLLCRKLIKRGAFPDILNEHTAELMVKAAPFHDLGKISIPDSILNKPGKLTEEERELIRYHPVDSAEFIKRSLNILEDEELSQIAINMALSHHERIDGRGYPYGLRGNEIPVSARIMAVADVIDALLSKRSYKEAYSLEKSFRIIKEMSGTALDPTIVDALLSSADEVKIIKEGGTI